MQNLEFREIEYHDFKAVSNIIRANWNYLDYGYSEEVCETFAFLDLILLLSESNFNEVVLLGNNIVGFLFGKVKGLPKRSDRKYLKEVVQILQKRLIKLDQGQLFLDYLDLYDKVDSKLIEMTNRDFESEIYFFALDPTYRRLGIGSKMLSHYLTFLKKNDISNVFVCTDSTCDFKFYDTKEFEKLHTISENARLRKEEKIDFYIYFKNLF